MSFNATFVCDTENIETEDEFMEDIESLRIQVSKLSTENECYKQEVYDLQRKLEAGKTMEAELREYNRSIEKDFDEHIMRTDRRLRDSEKKYTDYNKELENRLTDMENELAMKSKENENLRETIKINEEKIESLNHTQCSISANDDSEYLKSQMEELTQLWITERESRQKYEENKKVMEKEFYELKEILEVTKKQLKEKNEITESVKGELLDCRMELESLKVGPITNSSKGNSLFAEVEDRRKYTLNKMNAMKSSYLEAKRSSRAKEAEITALKTERALLLQKWEADAVDKIEQDANLISKYKARIAELENQLKDAQKKQSQTTKSQQLPKTDFIFLQSLVNKKEKEIEELRKKLENNSIHALLEEEEKHRMGRQLRYWRYKAKSGEAELLLLKNGLESNTSESNIEILKMINARLNEKKTEPDMTLKDGNSYRESTVINETVVTFDNLITLPKPPTSNVIDESIENLTSLFDKSTLPIERTLIDADPILIVRNNSMLEETKAHESESSGNCDERAKKMPDEFVSMAEEWNKAEYAESSITVEPVMLKSLLTKRNEDLSASIWSKDKNEKDKKTLRFADDTIDPPAKTLEKHTSTIPKYPIIFISSKSKK